MDAKLAAPCRHAGVPPLPVVERVSALIEALASDEEFLAKKWPSEKRFGLEGCEVSLIGSCIFAQI